MKVQGGDGEFAGRGEISGLRESGIYLGKLGGVAYNNFSFSKFTSGPKAWFLPGPRDKEREIRGLGMAE